MIQTLPRALAAIHLPAWKLLVAVAGCVVLVYAATYITRLEKRLPLIYYKRRLRVRPLALPFPSCFDKHALITCNCRVEQLHASHAMVAVAGYIALILITRMEKGLPLIHYKIHRSIHPLVCDLAEHCMHASRIGCNQACCCAIPALPPQPQHVPAYIPLHMIPGNWAPCSWLPLFGAARSSSVVRMI